MKLFGIQITFDLSPVEPFTDEEVAEIRQLEALPDTDENVETYLAREAQLADQGIVQGRGYWTKQRQR